MQTKTLQEFEWAIKPYKELFEDMSYWTYCIEQEYIGIDGFKITPWESFKTEKFAIKSAVNFCKRNNLKYRIIKNERI